MLENRKVFLWTAPRCVSTAFERSIYEIKNSKVFHEPFGDAYYFGPERQNFRYIDKPTDPMATYDNITKDLSQCSGEYDLIFAKDMAYAMKNHFNVLLNESLRGFQHTFLIRNPKKTITSLYRASVDTNLTGWTAFDPNESGFREMWELFDFVRDNFEEQPIVIDADDLLLNPKLVMEAYCGKIGLPFSEKILSWEPGNIDIWKKWEGWHDSVAKSSGFTPRTKVSLNKSIDLSSYPDDVILSIEENMIYYKKMLGHKVTCNFMNQA